MTSLFPVRTVAALFTVSMLSNLFAVEPHRNFTPVVRPRLPEVRGTVRTDVDRFILVALEAKKLSLNPEADRTTLIRRVAFDLTGLPPTVAEIDAFLADKSPDAYAKMVDRYLASPHYGERWGKFWLDAAGYADSNGYFNADTDRPLAWKYRDYVVKSFNSDKPYDRFVKEQIAGDELAGFTPGGDVTPAMLESLIATHFIRNAPDGTGESDGNPDEVRIDRYTVIEGNLQNVMNCLLGITVQCARCHDHKFEPLTQEEYYSLQALFFPVYNPEKWTKPNERTITVGTQGELAAIKRRNELIDKQVKAANDGLAAFAAALREQLQEEKKLDAKAKISDDDLAKRFPEFAALREQVKQTIAAREKDRPKPPEKIAAFFETDPNPPVHHLLKRGVHNQPGDEVQPGVPASLSSGKNDYRIPAKTVGRVSTGRRTAFANWVASPGNPLFVRVMVNRIWQHHFGTGLVATTDNLGMSGAKPSHPELLDYLAAEFVRTGWSVKAMHRLILNSAVYRQTSAPKAGLEAADPDNRLLSHFPLRRLDAESVRDAMLAISGELDDRLGGPYVPSHRTAEGVVEIAENADGGRKRSLYLQQRRTQVVTFLQLFDAPAIVSTCGKRSPSTVPLQSLALLNSEFARLRAKSFAAKLVKSDNKVSLAFRMVSGREPNPDERKACDKFLTAQRLVYAKEKNAEERSWADLCQMLLASNAFLYVE
ncbi:MAG TPA: DUF1549 and DUF1553 domain-containing protein [Urbifossiella sp.]|jgi:hypothetical protein